MPKKILLADDSITIQKVVELTFSDGDYEVVAVPNGARALAKLAEWRPDIVLADVIMPERNGYEVCEAIKQNPATSSIPVILLTGTFEPFDPERAERAGSDAVVTKPFESQNLIAKVEQLLAQGAPAAAPVPPPAAPAWEAPPVPSAASIWSEPAPPAPVDAPAASPASTGVFPPVGGDDDLFSSRDIEADIEAFEAPAAAPPPAAEPPPAPAPPPAPDPFAPFDEPPSIFDAPSAPAPVAENFGTMFIPSSSLAEDLADVPPPAPPAAAPAPPAMPEPAVASGNATAAFETAEDIFGAPAAPSPVPAITAIPLSDEPAGTMQIPRELLNAVAEAPPPSPAIPFEPKTPPPPPAPEPVIPMSEDAGGNIFDAPPPLADAAAASGATMFIPSSSLAEDPFADAPDESGSAFAPPPPSVHEPPPQPVERTPPISEPEPFAPEPPAPSLEPRHDTSPSPFGMPSSAPPMEERIPEPEPEPVHHETMVAPVEMPMSAPVAHVEPPMPEPPPPPPPPVALPPVAAVAAAAAAAVDVGSLSDEDLDRLAKRIVERLSDRIIREIAWEVVPELAEILVKRRIAELEAQPK